MDVDRGAVNALVVYRVNEDCLRARDDEVDGCVEFRYHVLGNDERALQRSADEDRLNTFVGLTQEIIECFCYRPRVHLWPDR